MELIIGIVVGIIIGLVVGVLIFKRRHIPVSYTHLTLPTNREV